MLNSHPCLEDWSCLGATGLSNILIFLFISKDYWRNSAQKPKSLPNSQFKVSVVAVHNVQPGSPNQCEIQPRCCSELGGEFGGGGPPGLAPAPSDLAEAELAVFAEMFCHQSGRAGQETFSFSTYFFLLQQPQQPTSVLTEKWWELRFYQNWKITKKRINCAKVSIQVIRALRTC